MVRMMLTPAVAHPLLVVVLIRQYNARYVSMSSYDLMEPGPVLQTLADRDISDFYQRLYGSDRNWQSRNRRQYKARGGGWGGRGG
jgi:hypothetical protein